MKYRTYFQIFNLHVFIPCIVCIFLLIKKKPDLSANIRKTYLLSKVFAQNMESVDAS